MKKLLLSLLLLCSNAFADNVLLVGSNDANIRARLEAAGHTVTYSANTPASITNYKQVWDLRYNNYTMTAAEVTSYQNLLKNNGFLYFAGENSAFATRNNNIASFVTNLGGGTITVGGSAANGQIGSSTYFSNGETATYIAAANITKTGSGRVLTADSSGNATAMMWVGNAGDFNAVYNGTVIVVADINWTMGTYFTQANQIFLDALINGIVEGTVQGTITATGTGTGSTPTPPAVATNPRPTWPTINRAANQIQFGTNRTGVWRSSWCDNYWGCGNTFDTTYINWNQSTGDGFHNYNYTYMRWPGTDNGVSRTIWFRIGYDDNHHLKINGQTVAAGPCCQYTYGSYTAKPGEIVKLEFWSDNSGGGPYIGQVAWDPDGDGVYTLLGSGDVGLQSPTDGGGSYWYSSDITTDQTNITTAAQSRVNSISGNQIWIEEKIGSSNNTVTIEQTGFNNRIHGLGGGDAIIDGQTNNITVKQGDGAGKNLVELGIYGASNTVTIWQARNVNTGLADGLESGGHYAGLGINGDSNTVTIKQGNEGAANSGHVGLIYVKGNSNNMTLQQSGNGSKMAFVSVDGNSNTSFINQYGVGSNHYIDLMMTGNGHTANITQGGTATQKATINLQNAGGASVLNLTQQGSTGQQYSIMQQCANLSGCSVTVSQGGP